MLSIFARRPRYLSLALLILLAGALLLANGLLPGALRAQQATLRFEPADLQLEPGDEATIEVWLDDVEGLYGLDLRLSFDPGVMEVLDENPAMDGTQVNGGDFPHADFEVKNAVSTDQAQIWYAVTQLNPREPLSGSGMVLSMRIRALAGGASYLDVQYGKFVNRDGLEIDVQTSSGEVLVSSSSDETMPAPPTRTATATATGLPSATPTPTATPTVEGVMPLPTATLQGGYANPTTQPNLPSATPYGGDDPYLLPTAYATPGPRPTFTAVDPNQPALIATPTGGYPLPGEALATMTAVVQGTLGATSTPGAPSGAVVTADPFAMPTQASSGAPRATDARIAMAIPTLEKIWPQGDAQQKQTQPLIPRETFICLSAGLVLVTLLLAFYIWRRGRLSGRSNGRQA